MNLRHLEYFRCLIGQRITSVVAKKFNGVGEMFWENTTRRA